jgi:hypothetical protein
MTENKQLKAAARAHAAATGMSYTRALRDITTNDATNTATGTPEAATAPTWKPAAFEVWTEQFDGPHWGGGLHTHGFFVTVFGRTEGGTGTWLTPENWPGDPANLRSATRRYIDEDGNHDLDWDHLEQALTTAFPGADVAFDAQAVNRDFDDADEEQDMPPLIDCEFTYDCDDEDCGGLDDLNF